MNRISNYGRCLGLLLTIVACGTEAATQSLDEVVNDQEGLEIDVIAESVIQSVPLTMNKSSYVQFETAKGSVVFRNSDKKAQKIDGAVIMAVVPGGTHAAGPFVTLTPTLGRTNIPPKSTLTLQASRMFGGTDAIGTWEFFARVIIDSRKGKFYDSNSVFVTLAADSPPPPSSTQWLHTSGNKIVQEDGTIWYGRGMTVFDTRSCNACAYNPPNVAEVKRRIDFAVDVWHATFLRLVLESYDSSGGRVHWQPVISDPNYLADLVEIVRYIGTKPGVYVLISLWEDPTFTNLGWPTSETSTEWQILAQQFLDSSHVLFGIVNEPQSNFSGSQDADVWTAMNNTAAAIRAVEDSQGKPHHIIAAQGTRAWGRVLDYYITHPLTAGSGDNYAYETHVYDPPSEFAALFENPSQSIPVIIGEFGPANMTLSDCSNLMQRAETLKIPYVAWSLHMRCPPNLLVDNSNGGCGVNMTLAPTQWGQVLRDRLAMPAL